MPLSKEQKAVYQRQYRLKNGDRIAAQRASFRAANKERIFKQKQEYRSRHRESIAAKKKEYRASNKARLSDKDRAYYAANRERLLAKQKAYYDANPDVYRSLRGRRRAAEARSVPLWADDIAIRTGYMVAAALRSVGLRVEVDHIVPLISDDVCGLHTEYNLTIVHRSENRAKSNSQWPDMWEWPGVA